MRIFCFQLLVHIVSKDDPAVHWARCLLDASRHTARVSGWLLGGLRPGARVGVKVKVGVLVFWHLYNCLTAIAAIREYEGNGLPHLLGQAVLEVLQEDIAKQFLDVALKQNHPVSVVPAIYASIECALELCHGFSVCGGGGEICSGRW